MDEAIKEAFSRVKQDIFSLGEEISNMKLLISDMKNELKILTQAFNDIREKEILTPTYTQEKPAIQQITSAQEEIPTDKLLSQVLRSQKAQVSIGNEGVPTNKQTNQQTNQHIIQRTNLPIKREASTQLTTTEHRIKPENIGIPTTNTEFDKVTDILNTLDSLRKEIRLKFKRLTNQEIAVFSLLYSLEESGEQVDYPLLSSKLSLSESSIRDYIGKIQKKGIPVVKEKIDNKKILLHISPELKKIASLDTILKLRDL